MTSIEHRQSRRILIIDDDPGVQQLLSTVLRRKGFEIVIARDGAEGVRAVKAFEPDLILLDLMMPKVDGVGFLRELEGGVETRRVPVIVVSAHLQNDPAQVLELGATTLLPKPFEPQQLLDLIECLL